MINNVIIQRKFKIFLLTVGILLGIVLFFISNKINNLNFNYLVLARETDKFVAKHDLVRITNGKDLNILRQAYQYYLDMIGVDVATRSDLESILDAITPQDYSEKIDINEIEKNNQQLKLIRKHTSTLIFAQNLLFLMLIISQIGTALSEFLERKSKEYVK